MPTPQTAIKPGDINAYRRFFEAFDDTDTEISAGWIVHFCQRRGRGWEPFRLAELQEYYETGRGHKEEFWFNRLTPRYVTTQDGVVHLTDEFVARCYAASPATR